MDATTKTSTMKRELSYDDKVIKKIAGIATDEVQGVLTVTGGLIGNITDRMRNDDKTKGIDADVGKKQVAMDLTVVCEYGRFVPELYDEVAAKVTTAIREMTGLEVVELNMHVDDILSKADFAELRQKQLGSKPVDSDGTRSYVPQSQQAQTIQVQ